MTATHLNSLLILLFAVLALACTVRREYQTSASSVLFAPNAININIASADELEKLPHIGRKTADAIVQFRTENGPFRRSEHLMQIRGISEKRFVEIRQYIRTE